MRFCDFFSGIGGFRIGLEQAGHKGVWACENDDYCRQIYAQHFEEPQGVDINDVKPEQIPEAELWTGGFPCQDTSVAGKGEGLKGEKSGIYWAWHKLIKKCKPEWLLIENVPGLLSSPINQPGADFQALLSSLVEVEIPMPRSGKWPNAGLIRKQGMEIAWRILNAQYFGLAQCRRRVFIIRHLGKGGPAEVLFECESGKRDPKPKREAGREIAASIEGCANNYGGLKTPIAGASAFRNRGTHIRAEASSYVIAHALTRGIRRGDDPTKDQLAISLSENQRGEVCLSEISPQISAGGGKAGQGYSAVIDRANAINEERSGKQFDAENEMVRGGGEDLRSATPTHSDGMRKGAGIQGRVHTPDSPRYKALGNAVAVPVIRWIGDRLARHG